MASGLDPEASAEPLFNWDLVSLEQNNPRFNASVLSGFHSIRSPGVTPARAWKTGLGVLYSREVQVAEASGDEILRRETLLLNPKLNYGLLDIVELGAGFEATWTDGHNVRSGSGAGSAESESSLEASAVDWGVKWGLPALGRVRLGLALDGRIAVNRGAFGTLQRSLYNVELDAAYNLTRRFSILSNLQYATTDEFWEEDQVIADLAASYSFSDRFRGMIFGTAQDEETADHTLFFFGLAGQFVFEQHSFAVSLEVQLNEAQRDVRTEKQIDVGFSYAFTF